VDEIDVGTAGRSVDQQVDNGSAYLGLAEAGRGNQQHGGAAVVEHVGEIVVVERTGHRTCADRFDPAVVIGCGCVDRPHLIADKRHLNVGLVADQEQNWFDFGKVRERGFVSARFSGGEHDWVVRGDDSIAVPC